MTARHCRHCGAIHVDVLLNMIMPAIALALFVLGAWAKGHG